MAIQPSHPAGEKFSKAGEVLLSYHHISLLHGLLDRPDGIAASVNDWVCASLIYARRYRCYVSAGMIRKSIRTMHPAWIHRQRTGRCIQVTLLSRGQAILDRRVASRIRGRGAYHGLPKITSRR